MNPFKEVVQFFYFVALPLFTLWLAWELRQLRIERKESSADSWRKIVGFTARQCALFDEKIAPLAESLKNDTNLYNTDFLKKSRISVEEERLVCKLYNTGKAVERFLDNDHSKDAVLLLDKLEGFATFLTSELASEEVAFPSVGRAYCSSFRKVACVTALMPEENVHQNAAKLFLTWNERLKGRVLQRRTDDSEELIKEILPNARDEVGRFDETGSD